VDVIEHEDERARFGSRQVEQPQEKFPPLRGMVHDVGLEPSGPASLGRQVSEGLSLDVIG
jgi:hypothetical protein